MKEEKKKQECKTTTEDWKRIFMEALIIRKNFRLIFRPKGIKFGENSATVLIDLDSYRNFFVGDLCTVVSKRWYVYEEGQSIPLDFKAEYRIVAFVKLMGSLREGTGTKIEDIFCVLSKEKGSSASDYSIQTENDLPSSPILLFWVGGLRK